jgi:UDPglucose 6-dehydrogenase
MKLAVIGVGYVANVTGACFAAMGNDVVVASMDEERIAVLQKGEVPFYENGLEQIVKTELQSGKLRYSLDIREACKDADIIFLCVSAPPLPDGRPDTKVLTQVLQDIAQDFNDGYRLIVERNNLPVKTGHWIKEQLQAFAPEGNTCEIDIASLPQFLREGHAVNDFYHPDRLIIGAETAKAKERLMTLYQGISTPVLITDVTTAELIKHSTNAFLAMKISFMNSISQLAEKCGADIELVAKGLGMDKRISPHFLYAGIGYGGIFLPRDVMSLTYLASQHHLNLDILKATETVNRYQRISFIERVEKACGGQLSGKTVAVWGLAYRPDTDDMRDSPSTQIIWGLQNRGATVRAYDPIAMNAAKSKVRRVTFCDDMYDCAKGADVIAIVTEWPQFAQVNFSRLKEETECRLIVDGRNLFSPTRVQEQGFTYYSMGRKPVSPDGSKDEDLLYS